MDGPAMTNGHNSVFDPSAFLGTVGGARDTATYAKGQIIFTQGETASDIHYLQSGAVKLSVVSEQGKEAVVAIVEAGEFFGEACLAGQMYRLATATAMMDCSILRLEKAAVVRLLHEEPQFAEMLIGYLLTRTIRVEADLVDQLFNSSEKRLARLLLLLANYGKEGKPQPVLAKISQEVLAEMIGTTRSRVSFFMNKFRSLGFISYNGHIEVHSSLLNVVLLDNPRLNPREPSEMLPIEEE
jgi:CRP/FNR family cyclic AMP-dependent transcriptional regulator